MRIIAAVAAMGLMSLPLWAQAVSVKDETDRFTGLRSVSWSTVPSSPEAFTFNTYAYLPEGQSAKYLVELLTWGDEGRYRRCNFVNWLVDGQRATDLEATYASSSAGSATIERFTINLDRKAIEKLATAKSVEYKVCGDEGAIRADDLEGLRQVLSATK